MSKINKVKFDWAYLRSSSGHFFTGLSFIKLRLLALDPLQCIAFHLIALLDCISLDHIAGLFFIGLHCSVLHCWFAETVYTSRAWLVEWYTHEESSLRMPVLPGASLWMCNMQALEVWDIFSPFVWQFSIYNPKIRIISQSFTCRIAQYFIIGLHDWILPKN